MTKETRNEDGELHSINDEPAVECLSGYKAWYQNGKRHRNNGHAVEYKNGYKEYWIEGKQLSEEEFLGRTKAKGETMIKETRNEDGKLHSFNDEPALINDVGDKFWYQNGLKHRVDGPAIECLHGNKYWYQHGKLHREGGPAVEYPDGEKEWYQDGKRHRVNGPAVECANGYKAWHQNGERHRVDGPAVEYPGGGKDYWIEGEELTKEEFLARTKAKAGAMKKETRNEDGKLHSFNDEPAFVSYSDYDSKAWSYKEWYQNGIKHRVDGPAIEQPDGYKAWYQNDKKHRLDGPAVEWSDGRKEYRIKGEKLTEQEFLERTEVKNELLLSASRQYMHNDGSGLIFGYEKEETKKVVNTLCNENDELRKDLQFFMEQSILLEHLQDRNKMAKIRKKYGFDF